MEMGKNKFFGDNPEGALIVALDSREDGLLFGAVELWAGQESWLDYEMEFGSDGDTVSLYRGAENAAVLEYYARGRRVDTMTLPDRLLVLWNRGHRALAIDGEPLSPGEVLASAPEGATPWLLRFANWLPGRE